ncbi:hypothetical protein ACIRG5_26200 [Lentzea sp. NPDC102401]|uniref:hypothetical protein n=1 Tax=Lentzea sp. NPDC102401 TaxID=3364128 RepID=UPI00381AFA36
MQKFGPLLSPNPHSLKLFPNAYSVLRRVRTLKGNPVPMETLALWTVVQTRWPRPADHHRAQPDHVGMVSEPKVDPEDVRPLFQAPAAWALVTFETGLAATAIRSYR